MKYTIFVGRPIEAPVEFHRDLSAVQIDGDLAECVKVATEHLALADIAEGHRLNGLGQYRVLAIVEGHPVILDPSHIVEQANAKQAR